MLHEPLDRAALAGGVASLEDDDVALTVVLRPVLQLEQLDLQAVLGLLVLVTVHQLVVGVLLAPRLDRLAARVDEHGIGALAAGDGVALGNQAVDVLAQVVLGLRPISVEIERRVHRILLRGRRQRL